MKQDFKQMALDEATKSKCEKRKVGAVIVDANDQVLGVGHNYNPSGNPCEDAAGATESGVKHAEAAAIIGFSKSIGLPSTVYQLPLTIYTTHAPCADCRAAIEEAGIANIVVVETFIKFDTDKLRYDLIPPEWHEGDAEILTFGAKKYKPNNWKEVDDMERYVAALERHLIAFRKGEIYDPETGLHHMKHLRTNAGFLLSLTEELKNETKD